MYMYSGGYFVMKPVYKKGQHKNDKQKCLDNWTHLKMYKHKPKQRISHSKRNVQPANGNTALYFNTFIPYFILFFMAAFLFYGWTCRCKPGKQCWL